MSRISPKPLKDYPWYLRLFYSLQKKKYGEPLFLSLIWGRHPRLLIPFLRMGSYFQRKSSLLPARLRTLILVKISQMNQCSFCIDLNAAALLKEGENALDELARYKESALISEEEKCALIYAEEITDSHLEVSDASFANLKNYFSEDAIVELTALISYQNLSSKFNRALKIEPHGFCKKPSS